MSFALADIENIYKIYFILQKKQQALNKVEFLFSNGQNVIMIFVLEIVLFFR